MLPVRTTLQFRLDVARAKRRGADPRSFRAFIDALAGGISPPYESRPVPGETSDLRVCGLPGFGNLLYRHTGREVVLIRLFPSRREHRTGRPASRRPAWQASPLTHAPIMLKNYAAVALRSFLKHKGFALINLLGLSVGLACCLLIFLFVQRERSFDDFHERGDRIYRLISEATLPGTMFSSGYTSARYAPMFAEDLPEIQTFARFTGGRSSFILSHGDRRFEEPGLLFADSTVFDVFTFPLLAGDARTALAAPFSIVLSEELVQKYFGDADPMGQPLRANGTIELTVTGVMADVPPNSHLRFDALLSMTTAEQMDILNFEDLLDFAFASYLLVDAGVAAPALDPRMADVLERRLGEQLRSYNLEYVFNAEPLRDVYLHSDRYGMGLRGNLENLYLFSAIALFILLIACINFMNLAG
jgi:putative ABC transport system permease protein